MQELLEEMQQHSEVLSSVDRIIAASHGEEA